MLGDLVFLSPITPASNGVGLAMRADRIVQALRHHYRVHLRVVPIQEFEKGRGGVKYDGPCASQERVCLEPSMLHRLRYWRHGELRRLSPEIDQALERSLPGVVPQAVFSFRHCLFQAGLNLRNRIARRARLIVDLDEMESNTRTRLAELYALRGDVGQAARLRLQATFFRERETQELRSADQVWLCSEVEADRLEAATGIRAAIVPNVVALPVLSRSKTAAKEQEVGDGARKSRLILFVGGLSYLPNFDAVEWMVERVLPVLGLAKGCPVQFRIVGKGKARPMQKIAARRGVEWRGYVEDLGAEYSESDLCVVPLRAGGGTRIKLLEALAHGLPVVSTEIGAEGLAFRDGRELAIADRADEFAAACRRLLESPAESESLAERGRSAVGRDYGLEALDKAVSQALEGFA